MAEDVEKLPAPLDAECRAPNRRQITMPSARVIFQTPEKVAAICATLYRAGIIAKADMKALADSCGINYRTLKSAVQDRRFSTAIEDAVANLAGFDPEHHSWVDETVSEAARRASSAEGYTGRDTIAHFRARLNAIWTEDAVTYRASRRGYSAFNPHVTRHELSDLGQSTADGVGMQFVLTAHFEPVCHRSGIVFGFRKVVVSLDIQCANGARAGNRLGYPTPATLRDATITGDGMSRQLRWEIERRNDSDGILDGEYSSGEDPLVTIEDPDNGTAITSRIEVNIFDRKTCLAGADFDFSSNKQALIEQIFWKELPEAEARNGWIVLSCEESVIARYEK